jgi:lantibiotic modifying enzyme
VAYTLATLHRASGERAFLDAAPAGARHLLDIGRRRDDGFLVYHHNGDGEDLYYLSWCHGPPGTARLFYRLHGITRDAAWLDWVRRSADGVVASGIPEQRTPGFWNNISLCCGNAGVGEFFLDLHGAMGGDAYLAFARRNATDLLRRGTEAGGGMKWVQAENRVSPDDVMAQTGLMQGAAGVGMLLLHLDGVEAGRRPALVLPDSPFTQ